MLKSVSMLVSVIIITLLGSCSSGMTQEQVRVYTEAKTLYLEGELDGASELLKKVKFGTNRGHQGKLLEAKILFMKGKPDESEAITAKLVTRNPGYTEAQLWLARALLAQGKTEAAQNQLEKAMEYNPDDPRILYLMANSREILKDYQQALEYYSRAALYGEELARAEISLAQLYYRFNQDIQALTHIQKAKALLSDKSVVYRPLIELEKRISGELTNEVQ